MLQQYRQELVKAARAIIEQFATRAFRRHADAGEVAALMRLYEQAKKAYAVVATSETALYANLILKKGVVAPQSP